MHASDVKERTLSLPTLVGRLTLWIRRPDQFDWFVGYLTGHGLIRRIQFLTAGTTLLYGVVGLIGLWSPTGPQSDLARTAQITVNVVVAVMSAWIVVRRAWPSRRLSLTYVAVSDLCIAASCVSNSDPMAGIFSCVCFAAAGCYVGFFHSSRVMLGHLAVTFATALHLAIRLGDDDLAAGIGKFLLVILANLTVPLAMQMTFRLLNVDAMNSRTDPLTGLLNRRGLDEAILPFAVEACATDRHLLAIAIDLDQFKVVNDTFGHATGDLVLRSVAHAVQRSCRSSAIVARIGGEEFLVVDSVAGDGLEWQQLMHTISAAIAESSTPAITASVGAASSRLSTRHPATTAADISSAVDALLYEADHQMYLMKRAKRNGST